MEKVFVAPDCEKLQYMGRIDFTQPQAPVFVFPCTCVKLRFYGTECSVTLQNTHSYWDNYMGYLVDGKQGSFVLSNEAEPKSYLFATQLPEGEHEVLLFKRMDSCHTVQFFGFTLNEGADIRTPEALPERRIEVYGDSVSAGEVSEAVEYVGLPDPEHHGELSNSYYSYAWMTARKLHAQLHDIAQGGVSLLDDTGWFAGPDCKGMLSMYDKIEYHPDLGVQRRWDFSRYVPDVVIVAIGQNDNHPVDYMAEDYDGEDAAYWRATYRRFVEKLRRRYPDAEIILATTILGHHANWDRAIDEVCRDLQKKDDKVHHFLYSKNGCGTQGHIRIPEADQMSDELSEYILKLGVFQNERREK